MSARKKIIERKAFHAGDKSPAPVMHQTKCAIVKTHHKGDKIDRSRDPMR
jgi:hypothetical protein